MSQAAQIKRHFARFVEQLWETGRVSVHDVSHPSYRLDDIQDGWLQLSWYASEEQINLPGRSPGVSRLSAEWALRQFYLACSFLIHRTTDGTALRQTLSEPAPETPCSQVCYSVDLVFRFLPDLHRRAQELSPNDPLVQVLESWGRDWPLSSVGMIFTGPDKNRSTTAESGEHLTQDSGASFPQGSPSQFDLDPWWAHECLRRIYLDRVMSRSDESRLTDDRVAQAARAAIGNFPELAPEIAAVISRAPLTSP